MSATLQACDLAAGHGDHVLFSELNLVVAPGDVVGLVGANGAGKSTLLRLLAGLDTPEHGSVSVAPAHASVGLLPQEPERRAGETVADYLARRTGVASAQAAMDAAATALGTGADGGGTDTADRYAAALERWLALGGADLEDRAPALLAEVGLDAGPDALMTGLSGGQAARAGLATLLASRYDVLLLDEPTNDLDLDGLARLEAFVTGLRAPAVIVSHDREFLARMVNRIVELDLAQRQVGIYQGGYQAYLDERETARRHAREAYEDYADTVDSLKATARTQRAWMAKGVRNARRSATSGTERDKFIRHHRGETSEKQAAKARQTERRIERLDAVEEPRKEWRLRMTIAAAPRA
ncbi:MAG: ABC-F family ATP-binding cassette domain-containing protein, partial [Pseudonocardiales bacterium]|nr:ABC-F family ATP-binding cassette domain-containing protein [Pseudonocardiales bacterium]